MQSKNENVKRSELTLYIAKQLRNGPCGTVKLNKLLFFTDMLAYGTLGRSITGASYVRQAMGPVAADMVQLRKDLVRNQSATIVKMKFGARPESRLVPLREPRTDVFSEQELRIVDHVIAKYGGRTGTELSKMSHEYAGWHLAKTGEVIPMATIFVPKKPMQPTPAQRNWASEVLKSLEAAQ